MERPKKSPGESHRRKAPRRTTKQGHLFRPSIQALFEQYHKEHPAVYELLVEGARKVISTGRAHYGIATLFEWARWHLEIERNEHDDYKLNNNFRSRYARMMMEQEPDLAGFFEIRELQSL